MQAVHVEPVMMSVRNRKVLELDGCDADVSLDLQCIRSGISCSVNEFAVLFSVNSHLQFYEFYFRAINFNFREFTK